MAITRGSRCENILAHDDHAPIIDELSGRSKRWLDQRTAAREAGGCVSSRGRWNCIDLVSKIVEKLKYGQAFRQQHEQQTFPLRNLSKVLSCQQTNKTKKEKQHKLPWSKKTGRTKLPPDLVLGDENHYRPSGWGTLTVRNIML